MGLSVAASYRPAMGRPEQDRVPPDAAEDVDELEAIDGLDERGLQTGGSRIRA
jgi:hypothetical protein